MKYLLAIDEGTTGCTVSVMDERFSLVLEESSDFEQHFPQSGWVEHDLDQVWSAVEKCLEALSRQFDLKSIAAIGITNQRETIGFWSASSGKPLCKAIVWQDRRSADICKELKAAGLEPKFQDRTGLLLDPYFSGTKIRWALQNLPAVQTAAAEGDLRVGTIDTFVISKLTSGTSFVTEPSNASRTLCMDLHSRQWSRDLCRLLDIPINILPEIKPSFGVFGHTKSCKFFPDGIPITGVLGDQQAALLGQGCVDPGMAKCTYGTGAFLLMNVGFKPTVSKHRLLSTVAWMTATGETTYALEGSAFIAGALVQWLRDGLGLIESSKQIEDLASEVSTSEGVVMVPALTGLGAPYWNPHARGLICGLTRGTQRAHLARAALEAIALQNGDLLQAMQMDLGKNLTQLRVDGGASANSLLMQIQADVLGVELQRPNSVESTSLGAMFAAAIGVGILNNVKQVSGYWKPEKKFVPTMSDRERKSINQTWKTAVGRANFGTEQIG